MKRILLRFVVPGLLAAVPLAPAASDENGNADAIVQSLVPPGGPDVLTFRGLHVHSINLRTGKAETAPLDGFDVQFGLNATALSAEAKDILGQHRADFASGDDRIVIEGHTDSGGQPDKNLAVSQQRADAVRDYIVREFGVAPSRIEAVGRGAADPLDPRNPQSALNRRVRIATVPK